MSAVQSEIQTVHGISSIGGQTGREPRRNPRSEGLRRRRKQRNGMHISYCSKLLIRP